MTDYTILTGAIDFSQIAIVLISVGALLIAFGLIRQNIQTIILFLGDHGIGRNSDSYQQYDDDRYEEYKYNNKE
jgi:hypothetical protein